METTLESEEDYHNQIQPTTVMHFCRNKCSTHCLNKRERPLHSERTSILRDEATLTTSIAKCPALLCSRHLVLVRKTLFMTAGLIAFQSGFFRNFLGFLIAKWSGNTANEQRTTQNKNKFRKSKS